MAARGTGEAAASALRDLCGLYYAPVVTFLRCTGHSEDQAREWAHAFFEGLLERPRLDGVDPSRGRFRTYLLGAVKHFVSNERARARASKRGAGHEHVEIGSDRGEEGRVDPPDESQTDSERQFDRQWGLTLLETALNRLEGEMAAEGRSLHFEQLKPWLTGDSELTSQREVALLLGMNEGAVKVAIHRLRKRFRGLVQAAVAETVPESSNIQEELQYLLTVLG